MFNPNDFIDATVEYKTEVGRPHAVRLRFHQEYLTDEAVEIYVRKFFHAIKRDLDANKKPVRKKLTAKMVTI